MTGEWEIWSSVVAAKIPVAELSALAALRTRDDLTVHEQDGSYWVHWSETSEELIRSLLPIPGVLFLSKRHDGKWSRFGSRLPTSTVPPDDHGETLIHRLSPKLAQPQTAHFDTVESITLTLVRSNHPCPVSAMTCSLKALVKWVETATTHEISHLKAAFSGDQVFVSGKSLPSIAGSQRLTGNRLLVPVGFRVEPNLGEELIRLAVGADESELALFTETGIELIPVQAVQPLTRAGIRLAGGPR